MNANLHRHWAESGELSNQLASMRSIGIVWFIGAEIRPCRHELPLAFAGINLDVDGFLGSGKLRAQRKC
jgi:hypothetical protein